MAKDGQIILATETPVFSDGGDFLLCELTSGGKKWAFGIPWHSTEIAMRDCGAVLDAHRQKCRITPFKRDRKGSPIPHG